MASSSQSQSGLSRGRRKKSNNNNNASESSSSEDNQLKQVVLRTKLLKIDDNLDVDVDYDGSVESNVSQNKGLQQAQSNFTRFTTPSQVQNNSSSSINSSLLNSSINSTSFRSDISLMPQSQPTFMTTVDEEMEEPTTNINDLPLEILCNMLNYLPNTDLIKCRSVCKKWKEGISSKFNILRIAIILRDINSREEDSKLEDDRLMITDQLHTVQVETLGSNSNPMIRQMSLAGIFSNLAQRRPTFRHVVTAKRRSLNLTNPNPNPSPSNFNQKSKFPSKYYRKNVWIYGVNLQVAHKEIEPLFRNYQHVISHLSLIGTREPGHISTANLFETLELLKDTLEFLELSMFPPLSDSSADNKTDLGFFKLNKLRVLKFSQPFNWMNTEQSAKIIRELLRMSQNVTEIQNFPFLLNFKQPVQNQRMDAQSKSRSRVQVDLGSSVTSMYFNTYHILSHVKEENQGMKKEDFIHQQIEGYTNESICPSFNFMKIDPNYDSSQCVSGFNKFLRMSKQRMKTLEIPPLLSFSHSIYIPKLPKLKEFIFTDFLHSELPFFPVDGTRDPNSGYVNLSTVQLNLDNLSSTLLQNYFPPGIFSTTNGEKYFKSVTNLKIHCTFRGDPGESFKIFSALFPNVLKLELKPVKGEQGNYLKYILPRIPVIWPNLTHLILHICEFVQLRNVPEEFVTLTIPNHLRALISLKFQFSGDIPEPKIRANWIIRLEELLSNNLLPNLTVYVFCGWRLDRLSLKRVSKYFEIMHRVVKYNF